MRTVTTFVLAVACVVAVSGDSFAQIKGTTMGGLTTVVSDGAFDAARNPALLGLQKSPHAFAAYGKYRPYYSTDFDLKNDSMSIKRGEPETMTFGGIMAYSYSSGSTMFGIAAGEAGGDLYNYSKANTKFNTPTGYLNNTEETREYNPSLVMSLAFPVGESSSIGFQIATTYNQKATSITEKTTYSGSPASTLTKDKTAYALSAGAGFGYLYSTPDSQAGILIRSGNAEVYYDSLDFTYDDYASPPGGGVFPYTYSKSDTSKKRIRYNDPASIAVGGYKRFTPLFACAFESVYTLVSAYPSKNLDDVESEIDSDVIDIKLVKTYSRTREKIDFKGGIELNFLPQLSCTLGAGYSYTEMSTRSGSGGSGSSRSRTTLEILYSSLGIHYSMSEKTVLTLTVFFADVKGSFDIEESNFGFSADAPTRFFDTGLGVTTKF